MNEPIRVERRVFRTYQATILILLTIIAAGFWDDRPSFTQIASAQIPDTAMQRKQMVDEQKATNELLTRILKHLETKTIKVRTVESEEHDRERSLSPAAPRSGFGHP